MELLDLNTTDPAKIALLCKNAVEKESARIFKNKNILAKLWRTTKNISYNQLVLHKKQLKLEAIQNILDQNLPVWKKNKFKDFQIFRYLLSKNEESIVWFRGLFSAIEQTPTNITHIQNWLNASNVDMKQGLCLLGIDTTIDYRIIMPDSFYKLISPDFVSILIDLKMYTEDNPTAITISDPQHRQLLACVLNNTEVFYTAQLNNNKDTYEALHISLKNVYKDIINELDTIYACNENKIICLLNILHLCDHNLANQIDTKKYKFIQNMALDKFKYRCPLEYAKYQTIRTLDVTDLNTIYKNVTCTPTQIIDVELPTFN